MSEPRQEFSGVCVKRFACGSKESDSPPFPFPPPGASRGHRHLRYATARARHRPKAERSSAFWAGNEEELLSWGLRPQTPLYGAVAQSRLRLTKGGPAAGQFAPVSRLILYEK
jgi:hypothetical protein